MPPPFFGFQPLFSANLGIDRAAESYKRAPVLRQLFGNRERVPRHNRYDPSQSKRLPLRLNRLNRKPDRNWALPVAWALHLDSGGQPLGKRHHLGGLIKSNYRAFGVRLTVGFSYGLLIESFTIWSQSEDCRSLSGSGPEWAFTADPIEGPFSNEVTGGLFLLRLGDLS